MLPVVLVAGPSGALFLATTASCRVAGRTDRRGVVAATAVAVAVLPFASFLTGRGDRGAVYFAFGSLFGMLSGVLLRRSQRLAGELQVADARLAEAASRAERQRIARDVHDLVAHSLTVVVLHVGGARRVLRADPAAAEGALADAERVCRESLDGVRGVVGLLRDDGADPRALSLDLGELAGAYRAAGLPVALRVDGDPAALPLVARVTLHHVVREALANAARHAGPGSAASVDVAVDAGGATARIANDRRAAAGASPAAPGGASSGGFGLVGLSERVASLGGQLHSGPRGDAWVVECRLPVAAAVQPVAAVPAGEAP